MCCSQKIKKRNLFCSGVDKGDKYTQHPLLQRLSKFMGNIASVLFWPHSRNTSGVDREPDNHLALVFFVFFSSTIMQPECQDTTSSSFRANKLHPGLLNRTLIIFFFNEQTCIIQYINMSYYIYSIMLTLMIKTQNA